MRVTFSFLLWVAFSTLATSCHKKSRDIHLPTIKNIRLFTTGLEFGATIDSLVQNDPTFEYVPYEGKKFVQMRIDRDAGNPYYAYFFPSYDKGLVTKLTLLLSSTNSVSSANSFINGQEGLLYWGSPERTNDEMFSMIQGKYGAVTDSGYLLSINSGTNHILRHKGWEKDGLKVKLISEVPESIGLSDFTPFCNFIVEYEPTDKFLKENEKQISEYRQRHSVL